VLDFSNVMSLSGLNNNSFYMHVDELSNGVNNMMSLLGTSKDSTVPIERAWNGSPGENRRLPPSSLHSFLAQKRDIPGLVIGDFKESFSNPNFNSEFDQGTRFLTQDHADKLCQVQYLTLI
jgi:hypothetical protein